MEAVITRRLDLEDAYLTSTETEILGNEPSELVVAASNFFPSGGGQPGDSGTVELPDGLRIAVVDTVYAPDRRGLLLVLENDSERPPVGTPVVLHLDWARRHKLMRMHTALHLLTVVCPFPVTGAAVGEDESRLDFDMPDMDADKSEITERLMRLVSEDHPVSTTWITDDELDANPALVKSANVKPPRGSGRVRLVAIGTDAAIDSQPCGGTHVRATGEIGAVHIGKIEKKGRSNRRFRLRFGPPPA